MIRLSNFDGNVLFGRRYRVIVSNNSGNGLDVSQLRCTFNVEKSMTETPNYSEVTLYNLSAQTRKHYSKNGFSHCCGSRL